MQNIALNKVKFQKFLETLIYIYQLGFDCLPEPEPYVCPVYINHDRIALKKAVEAFEIKKRGGVAR